MQTDSTGGAQPWFIGCSCDRKFIEHTAVMLTSISVNGDVPDATIIVAGFGLTREDQAILRAGANREDDWLRFIAVGAEMLSQVNESRFTTWYPPAVLGRLLIADTINAPDARLVTIDSDLIVNVSLRPLLGLDLKQEFFAAIHDPRVATTTTTLTRG